MADNRLNVDIDLIRSKAQELSGSLDSLAKLGSDPFSIEVSAAEAMQADFTARLSTILHNLNQGNREIVSEANAVVSVASQITNELEGLDKMMANEFGTQRDGVTPLKNIPDI